MSEQTPAASEPQAASVNATRRGLKIAISVLGATLAVLLGVLAWQSYLGPQRAAQSALDGIAANQGPIAALNSSMATFEGQKLDEANIDQKGLAQGSELTTPPAFIFTNGKQIADRKVVNFYFDFSDQRSRDALISNSISLKSLVESGQIELRLHPLFGGRAYSMYAAEALSEVFAADTNLAWESLMVLLRNAPALADSDSNGEVVESIVSLLKNSGVTAVDEESIQNGTFATWLLSIGNDPKLNSATGLKLPYILVDERPLTLDVNSLNDPDAFKSAVIREISR